MVRHHTGLSLLMITHPQSERHLPSTWRVPDYVGPKLFSFPGLQLHQSLFLLKTQVCVALCPRFHTKKAVALPFSVPLGFWEAQGAQSLSKTWNKMEWGQFPLWCSRKPNGISNNIMLTSLGYRWKLHPMGTTISMSKSFDGTESALKASPHCWVP